MSYQKIVDLIRKIKASTVGGSIVWHETELSDVFQVSFSSYSARISKGVSHDDGFTDQYFLSILNDDGDVIERVGDEDGRDEKERSYLFSLLRETYDTARRQSMGVDQAIDSIMGELDGEIRF